MFFCTVDDGRGVSFLNFREWSFISKTQAPAKRLLRGGFDSPFWCVKTKIGEIWCQNQLADAILFELLEKCDADLAENCRKAGCRYCDGKLHYARFKRKPRGGPKEIQATEVFRNSLCCDQHGCRKRHTPASVRFLGRKVYWGLAVVLVSAMRHGLSDERMRRLRELLGVDRRTVERWRQWWLEQFVESSFWKDAKARFAPPLCQNTLPWSLCQAFGLEGRDPWLKLLEFISPCSLSNPIFKPM